MTTKLEKQFFDTFGIKARIYKTSAMGMTEINHPRIFPEITDRHYLELYCALCNAFNLLNVNRIPAFAFNIKDFKKFVLKDLIFIEEFYKNKYIKHQVQAIFKGD